MNAHGRGMTLIELLVVLTILALLTTVAVTSTDMFVGQERHDATARTLRGIEEAVLGSGDARQVDGTLVITGFLADVGRLPVAVGNDPTQALAELWANPLPLAPFAIRPAASDPEVLVASGWRGPYLRLPMGASELRDGWGRPFVLLDATGNPAGPGAAICTVRSLGQDGLPGGDGYDADLEVSLAGRVECVVAGNVYLLDSDGHRQNPPDPAQVQVRLYAPNPATGERLETSLPLTTGTTGAVSFSAASTLGPRYLRAYLAGSQPRMSDIVRIERSGVMHLEIR